MPLDLVIPNGTGAIAAHVFRADIGIQDGKIVQIGGDIGQVRQTLDATDRYVLPGGIDSHVQIDDINATSTRERAFARGFVRQCARMRVNVRLESWRNQRHAS